MPDSMNDEDLAVIRALGENVIRYNTGAYRVSGNPWFLWQVYIGYRDAQRPIPEWVLGYFDAAALSIARGEPAHSALGMSRDGARPIRMKDKTNDRLDTYTRHFKLSEAGGMTDNEIIDQIAADKNVDQKTVRNHLGEINAALENKPAG